MLNEIAHLQGRDVERMFLPLFRSHHSLQN